MVFIPKKMFAFYYRCIIDVIDYTFLFGTLLGNVC